MRKIEIRIVGNVANDEFLEVIKISCVYFEVVFWMGNLLFFKQLYAKTQFERVVYYYPAVVTAVVHL